MTLHTGKTFIPSAYSTDVLKYFIYYIKEFPLFKVSILFFEGMATDFRSQG